MSDWHIPGDLIASFSVEPGEIDEVTAASIEQHLISCDECRTGVAAMTPRSDMSAIWREVEDSVDRSGAGITERMLRWFGLDTGPARLMAATPALRSGALAAIALIVAAVVIVSRSVDRGDVFLALAPVVPTALVALSFAPGADPAGECGMAAPLYGFGLLMRRVAAVELVALALLAVSSWFVPIDGPRALGWLLPSLAMSLATVAGGVRWSAPATASALIVAWFGTLALAEVVGRQGGVTESFVFDGVGQAVLALVVVGSCVVVAANRQTLFQEVGP